MAKTKRVHVTGYDITYEQILALETEAFAAGDDRMVDICQAARHALRNGTRDAGDITATQACADVINAARDME